MFHNVRCLLFLTSLSLFWGGCGKSSDAPTTAPVQGVVTYQGKPVPSANVMFSPQPTGPVAVGTTDEEGRFNLLTGGKDGAMIGAHQVSIQAIAVKPGSQPAQTVPESPGVEKVPDLISLIPENYGSLQKSGLTAEVEQKKLNEFRFDLK